MEKRPDDLYYKGYLAGYRDGIADAGSGKAAQITGNDLALLPIKAMALSTRAYNCLLRAGCIHISDVANISDSTIHHMRNMGNKTAAEIARWMDSHGFHLTAWATYL